MFDIVQAEYIDSYTLEIIFENNIKGKVDFSEYLSKKGLFESLKNLDYFKKFSINKDIGTICWDNGLDIAPDTLYKKMIKE